MCAIGRLYMCPYSPLKCFSSLKNLTILLGSTPQMVSKCCSRITAIRLSVSSWSRHNQQMRMCITSANCIHVVPDATVSRKKLYEGPQICLAHLKNFFRPFLWKKHRTPGLKVMWPYCYCKPILHPGMIWSRVATRFLKFIEKNVFKIFFS